MKSFSLVMGYEIKTTFGPVLKPTQLQFWDQNSRFSEFTPHAPLKFMNDALIGLHLKKMTFFKNCSEREIQFINEALDLYCPYQSLFNNSSTRLQQKLNIHPSKSNIEPEQFENDWFSFWKKTDFTQSFNFNVFGELFNLIAKFEEKTKKPLLYNCTTQFSNKLNDHLVSFYSFLFHLRTIIALDHNAHVDDSCFESLKCDSITDYLPKADFTTNDALIYWQFKKLSTPFVGHKDKDIRIEKLLVEPLQRAFDQYNHNACFLVDQLPPDFLARQSNAELEEELHTIQMDWLLGSSSGLLFRIREELYGLAHGYDQIFWTEASQLKPKKPTSLKICFEMDSRFTQSKDAA